MGAGVLEDAYIQALRPLQDGVPPKGGAEVRAIVERALGQPLDALFSSFSPEPIGSASVGQVHRATLRDGTTVAVKVLQVTLNQIPGMFSFPCSPARAASTDAFKANRFV